MEGGTMNMTIAVIGVILALGAIGFYLTRKNP
jgi:LPXTG-motif cell wall-anchored protein